MATHSQHGVDAGQIFSASWNTLLQPNVWIGVVVGAR